MNKFNRGDYGPVPKSAPKSAKGLTVKAKSYAASPKPPRTSYKTSTSSSLDKTVQEPGEGIVKYASKVTKR